MAENFELETERIQSLGRELRDLPPARNAMTQRQIVALLAGDIQRARDKGYTLKEIVGHLKSNGLDLHYDTVRHALPRQTKSRSGKKKPSGRAAGGERARSDLARLRVVAPSGAPRVAPATRAGPPAPAAPAPETRPGASAGMVFPPGASSVPTGDGRFIPAPDSEVL